MQITNNFGLPEILVKRCQGGKHNKEHSVSATTLLSGIRAYWLNDRHFDEISGDVSDMVWSLFGTAFHSLLEEETENTFVEEYLSKKTPINNWTVTGKIDGYNMATCEIYDWKTTSVWKVVNKDFDSWRFQGLVYAWLCKQNGLDVNRCQFIACLKDHSKMKAKLDSNYPQHPVVVYKFDVTETDLQEIEEKIIGKVAEIAENENTPDAELPLCSAKERWAKEEYAVMKEGRKTAVRVFKDIENPKELAEKCADAVGGYVVNRSTDGKCNGYCSCCEFCTYWKEHYCKE